MMPGPDRPQVHDEGRVRGVLLALALLGNPLLYAWSYTTGGAFPDSIAYLSMARDLVEHGRLYVESSGHVDLALVLPPLYPLLVGVASKLYADPVLVSQWLSGAMLILAALPLFLLVERASNAWAAAAATLAFAWHPSNLLYGTSSLTEATFMLTVVATGWAAARVLARPEPQPRSLLALGALAAVTCLARQLGLFALPVLLAALVALRGRDGRPPGARGVVKGAVLLGAGFAAVIGPYVAVLFAQTGHTPWTHAFRMNHYVVTAEAAPAPPAATPDSYAELYAERRELRQLLPDSSEMLGFVVPQSAPPAGPGRWLASPAGWVRNLQDNLAHARALVGVPALALALLGLLGCALRPGTASARPARIVLAGFASGYLLFLSLLTGLVERYVEVALPLVLALAVVGAHDLGAWALRNRARMVLVDGAIPAAALALLLLALPQQPGSGNRVPKVGERDDPRAACRQLLEPGAGIFAFHPIEAYLAGGAFRIVPNAGLPQIAEYGRRTGTRWFWFRASDATARETPLYSDAAWLQDPAAALVSDADFVPRCGVPTLGAVLFEIVDPTPGGGAQRD